MSKSYLESQHLTPPPTPPPTPHTHIDSLTNNYSDGNPIRRRCIIEALELELIKENSLVSVTHHFEVAEYFNRALFLGGNEIQTKSEDEEDFLFVSATAQRRKWKIWSRLFWSEAVGLYFHHS